MLWIATEIGLSFTSVELVERVAGARTDGVSRARQMCCRDKKRATLFEPPGVSNPPEAKLRHNL